MSAPFDPSKLDLDISKSNAPEKNEQKEASKNQENIPKNTETLGIKNKEVATEDILDTIEIPQESDDNTSQKPGKKSEEEQKKDETTQVQNEKETKEHDFIKESDQDIVEMIESSDPEDTSPTELGEPDKQKLIDINITSLEDIITLLQEKNYDHVIIEPEDTQVKITFKQDNIDRDIKYIKYPIYTTILFSVKQSTKMMIEDTGNAQEGKGDIKVGKVPYKVAAKTAPGQNGERIWIKAKQDTSEANKKQVKKASLSMILGFLGAILFVGLILGGSFIAFIVLNAKTVEDVRFFASLGINLNDINTFISQVVTIIFSILLFFCTAALSFGLFKFFLTKKVYKRKKITYGLVSLFMLLLTFGTGSAWMVIDSKIKNLPNWQEQAYGDLKIFDNSLLINQDFTPDQALLQQTENLIGPITLQFNLENFQTNQARKGVTVKKYVWNFGDETIETFEPIITKAFNEKRNYEIAVTAIGDNLQGEEMTQDLANIPPVSISHLVEVQQTTTTNGGKKLAFDASDLENLGKVEWYFKENISDRNPNPDYPEWTRIDEGYEFIPGKIFFEEIFVGLSLITSTTTDPTIDKILVISPDGPSDISGEIDFQQDIENELEFTLFVKNPSTEFADGFIENYVWSIGDKTLAVTGTFENTNTSPSIDHTFLNYGENEVSVEMTDTKGNTKTLSRTINIQKRVTLKAPLVIFDEDEVEIEGIRYESKSHEYFIDALGIPASLKFDARYVRPESILYSLQDVSWDVGNDGNIDSKGKSFTYEVPTEGNHIVTAEYLFVHRKNPSDTINLKEFIFIEGIKKEAILDLEIEKDTNYAPVTVRFDASKSFIKNDDIIKFVYDYGDGFSEERDAINPGHRYTKAGDYTVKLTVIGSTGKTYSIEKKLILLPPPQTVKISTSLKKAPIGQGIDFSSAESEGQIIEYFWDFGDGNVSTQANPTHSYSKPGIYEVKLKVDFTNNNSITDEMEIEIIELQE